MYALLNRSMFGFIFHDFFVICFMFTVCVFILIFVCYTCSLSCYDTIQHLLYILIYMVNQRCQIHGIILFTLTNEINGTISEYFRENDYQVLT